jgi:hypothetical protein
MTKLTGSLGVRNEINVDIIGTGARGKEGKSAYEIWLDLGNEGTEQEYLASLKGEQGIQGEPGAPGDKGDDGKDGAPGADGITPHIGPNGNWFVGDIDTSIKAEGQDGQGVPAGGTAGQKLVKASDADFDTRWCSEPVYELIEEITVTEEDVVAIERTQHPDGTPYSFSAIYIAGKSNNPAAGFQPRFHVMYNNTYLSGSTATPGNVQPGRVQYFLAITENQHGIWITHGAEPQNGAAWSGTMKASVGWNPTLVDENAPVCNRIMIEKAGRVTPWEVGSQFKIYGVRA